MNTFQNALVAFVLILGFGVLMLAVGEGRQTRRKRKEHPEQAPVPSAKMEMHWLALAIIVLTIALSAWSGFLSYHVLVPIFVILVVWMINTWLDQAAHADGARPPLGKTRLLVWIAAVAYEIYAHDRTYWLNILGSTVEALFVLFACYYYFTRFMERPAR